MALHHSKPVVTTGGDKGRERLPTRRRRRKRVGQAGVGSFLVHRKSWPSPSAGLSAKFPEDHAGPQEMVQADSHEVRMALCPDG